MSGSGTYTVAVVLDRAFGERITALAQRMHVWVRDTPENQRVAKTWWLQEQTFSSESGITTFRATDSDSPESMLIGVLRDVDLHHGSYSHTPPWGALEVYGAAPTQAVRDALAGFGVNEFVEVPQGFVCRRAANPRS